VRGLGRVVARVDERVGRQHHRGEVGGAQQRPAHLLEHHDQLDVGEPGTTELLGDDEALQAHLLGHLVPDRVVGALLGGHELAHRSLGGLVLQELPNDATQFFLLLAEGEIHRVAPRGTAGTRPLAAYGWDPT
jgi:hypothetical protein